jgi:hypothetical protein
MIALLWLCAAAGMVSGEKCKYTRQQAMECARHYVDTDKDGAICREEIQQAMDAVSQPIEQLVELWYTPAYVMRQCDYDNDGFITLEDFERTEKKCLHDCMPRTVLFEKFCNRLAKLPHPLPPVVCSKRKN